MTGSSGIWATRDYTFDVARMVNLQGDTGTYLQYAYARIQSILTKAASTSAPQPAAHPQLGLEPAERALGLLIDELPNTLAATVETAEPHRLSGYLYNLATSFTTFYEHCPVLKAPDPATTANRLLYCQTTAETLKTHEPPRHRHPAAALTTPAGDPSEPPLGR